MRDMMISNQFHLFTMPTGYLLYQGKKCFPYLWFYAEICGVYNSTYNHSLRYSVSVPPKEVVSKAEIVDFYLRTILEESPFSLRLEETDSVDLWISTSSYSGSGEVYEKIKPHLYLIVNSETI